MRKSKEIVPQYRLAGGYVLCACELTITGSNPALDVVAFFDIVNFFEYFFLENHLSLKLILHRWQ